MHGKQLLSEFIIEGQLSMDEKFNAMKLISFEDLNAFLPKTQQVSQNLCNLSFYFSSAFFK